MRYRRFGKTDLQISVFSLGTMRCLASQENLKETLQKAVDLGINHIETAKGYGKSEQYIGAVLADLQIPRSQLYITTKLPPINDANIMRQWINESLENLQLDYLDCLAIHGINTWEHLQWIQAKSGCILALQEAIADGRVRHHGFSTHAPQEIIIEAINTDLFQFINLHYYYFFQRHETVIELANQKDMGVFIISPADKGGRLYTPSETLENLCNPFSPLELNARFLLSDARVTTLSVGAANPEELIKPLEVADNDHPLTSLEIEVFNRLETHLINSLNLDLCSQCYQCLPCPEIINIPEVLRLRNLAVAYDMIDYGKYRYQMFENAGHWFPGVKANRCNDCGDCLPRCPQNLDIPKLLRDTHDKLNGENRKRLWE